MTAPVDPWRTLGLAPGSSADEVRRAYRRLAKANHPDAAGEGALPRFLAIQAAYEQLVGARTRRRPGLRPAPGRSPDVDREPWRADPDRARASGRADRRRPGARPTSGPTGAGRTEDRPSGRATEDSGRATEDGAAPGGARAGRRPAGRSDDDAGSRPSHDSRSRRGGRTRTSKKATPYSTSYDPADDEPFEPGWSGATWYGASSGTYWTINPKEYADPRKHGPEYQRRARRSRAGWILDDDRADAEEPVDEAAASDAPETPDAPETSDAPHADGERPTPRSSRPASRSWTDARGHTDARAGRPQPAPSVDGGVEPREPSPVDRLPRFRPPTSWTGRLIAAIVAWPFLGGVLALSIQESSGCGRFAASCPELSAPGTWLLLAAILMLLLALPRVVAWLVTGTIAAFVAGAAAAVALSAGGGTALPEVSTPILGAAVIVAYVGGVLYAILVEQLDGRSRRVP